MHIVPFRRARTKTGSPSFRRRPFGEQDYSSCSMNRASRRDLKGIPRCPRYKYCHTVRYKRRVPPGSNDDYKRDDAGRKKHGDRRFRKIVRLLVKMTLDQFSPLVHFSPAYFPFPLPRRSVQPRATPVSFPSALLEGCSNRVSLRRVFQGFFTFSILPPLNRRTTSERKEQQVLYSLVP